MKYKPKSQSVLRLNQYLSKAGITSRRKADELIASGLVKVNNKVVTEMGFKVYPKDYVEFQGNHILPEKFSYLLLNKSKGYITTVHDEKNRKTVLDLIQDATIPHVYPVGRLDRNTTGVLLLTNDGNLSNLLIHPSSEVPKIYSVKLNKSLSINDLNKLLSGIILEDGEFKADDLAYTHNTDHSLIGIKIHSGKNRIVRRAFELLGYTVEKLDRTSFAGLTKEKLKRGKWRELRKSEVDYLKKAYGKHNL